MWSFRGDCDGDFLWTSGVCLTRLFLRLLFLLQFVTTTEGSLSLPLCAFRPRVLCLPLLRGSDTLASVSALLILTPFRRPKRPLIATNFFPHFHPNSLLIIPRISLPLVVF